MDLEGYNVPRLFLPPTLATPLMGQYRTDLATLWFLLNHLLCQNQIWAPETIDLPRKKLLDVSVCWNQTLRGEKSPLKLYLQIPPRRRTVPCRNHGRIRSPSWNTTRGCHGCHCREHWTPHAQSGSHTVQAALWQLTSLFTWYLSLKKKIICFRTFA